jgi:hypothetical protein
VVRIQRYVFVTIFGNLQSNGILTNVRMIKHSDIQKCRHFILDPDHYSFWIQIIIGMMAHASAMMQSIVR